MAFTIFRSLRLFNFRLWSAGALVSNIGTWMQRTAQDWLVLTQLTEHSATAVGVTMGLQFGPQLLLLPWSGYVADRFDRRKLLIATQLSMCVLSLALGLLSVTRAIRLWQVYLLTFLSGCVSAMDAPARQTFVSDLVGEMDLTNAVALNSMSFNIARMLGPAIAGLVIAAVGCGWAFLSNAASFAAVLASLRFLRRQELHPSMRAGPGRGNLAEGFRYVWSRPDLKAIMWMLALIGTFGLNFPIFISTMSVKVFHGDASQYGALTGTMAVGTVLGALLAAGRERPHFGLLWLGASLFGSGFVLAMLTPVAWMFGVTLVIIGVSALTFTNATSSLLQLSTSPTMRGRVMALRLAVGVGATPIGAPLVGWVADTLGPRWALSLGAVSGFAAAAVALNCIFKFPHLRQPNA
ncbi:MFS family permease [Herbaspirillum sp. Sphag1AN]|uniref:MFS transporter n=1 Tax=unclassified Herbaspirillum TaxID=2624150 RepID=UPI00160E963A|nr:MULTISPECIES: MFS transporter [unclassified Herbaspirillum]MBB3213242.1 MFS family permease [Herbaspirillum sp. Sphag1AN]MBB3246439.1 MFS family permease [Herbaspirillum sp. Sphag64]